MDSEKKIIFSGIQPSGSLTLGNYIGALRNWSKLQEDYSCYFCVVDLHAITVRQDPAMLRKRCMDTLCLFIASGIDPVENTIFFQSHVSAHAELSWVLSCNTYFGELGRMIQFKEKSQKHSENVNAGLFTYPVLMAADILLYQADLVPVGADQKQHLEMARDLAVRFNNAYSETFKVPEPFIGGVGSRIMSLADPTSKMSKSDANENGYILMLDEADVIARKIKRAVTDSDGVIAYDENRPGIYNLINIMSACSGITPEQIVDTYEGKGYGDFKMAVADSVIACLEPLQKRYNEIRNDKAFINEVMARGDEKAAKAAYKTLNKVYKKVGFAPRNL